MTAILTPDQPEPETFTDAAAAVDRLKQLYSNAIRFLGNKKDPNGVGQMFMGVRGTTKHQLVH